MRAHINRNSGGAASAALPVIALLAAAAVLLFVAVYRPTAEAASDTTVSPLDRLIAIEEIHQLKARYFRCVDTKDWECWRGLFSPDMTFKGSRASRLDRRGPQGMMALITDVGLIDRIHSTHHGYMPEIEILTPTTARGIWAMDDQLYYPAGVAAQTGKEIIAPGQSLHGYGYYYETYVRLDGRWYIQSAELRRTRMDTGGVAFP